MSSKNTELMNLAKKHMVGVENATLPSFTPDRKQEEDIHHG
jgi:hypothetical protein